MTRLPNKLALSKHNNSKLASSKNNGIKSAIKINDGNSKVGFDSDSIEHAKKSRKSKSQKLAKSQKLSKSKKSKNKKLLKCENSPNFNITKARPSFLTPNIKTVFNCLQ